jgi:GH24 family phage-related lysozyme (muramidase)
MQSLLSARGIHGSRSLDWVLDHPIHITRQQADVTFFRVTRIYWHETERRFGPGVNKLDPTVKGVLLSLVMNYGGSNSALDPIAEEISNNNINALAETIQTLSIGSTTDSHMQLALTKRRNIEHDFVNKAQTVFDSASEVDPD